MLRLVITSPILCIYILTALASYTIQSSIVAFDDDTQRLPTYIPSPHPSCTIHLLITILFVLVEAIPPCHVEEPPLFHESAHNDASQSSIILVLVE